MDVEEEAAVVGVVVDRDVERDDDADSKVSSKSSGISSQPSVASSSGLSPKMSEIIKHLCFADDVKVNIGFWKLVIEKILFNERVKDYINPDNMCNG